MWAASRKSKNNLKISEQGASWYSRQGSLITAHLHIHKIIRVKKARIHGWKSGYKYKYDQRSTSAGGQRGKKEKHKDISKPHFLG